VNTYERIYSLLVEMRKGSQDTTSGRSSKYQTARDTYSERLKSVRKNIQKAGAKPSSLTMIRRKTGKDPMPKIGSLPKEMVGRSRGRTAKVDGERTDPRAPAGTARSGAFVLGPSGEGEETAPQKTQRGQAADAALDQLRRNPRKKATASDLAKALGAKIQLVRRSDNARSAGN